VAELCVVFVFFNFCSRFRGKLFLVARCCIVFHSFCFFSDVSGRRCILVIWYLKAAVLCSNGWLDSKLIFVSVVVGFLYMSISRVISLFVKYSVIF
jgi:hypothetical protein